jgi:alkylated DNA repair dioxygenase AlkB
LQKRNIGKLLSGWTDYLELTINEGRCCIIQINFAPLPAAAKPIRAAVQHGIAADRFAREIVGFLKALPARLRHLNANPFGRTHHILGTPPSFLNCPQYLAHMCYTCHTRIYDLSHDGGSMSAAVVDVPGLHYVAEYLAPEEQTQLLVSIDQQPWLHDLKRRVQHYGYRYDYTRRSIDDSLYLGALPPWSQPLAERLLRERWSPRPLDQLIINEYLPGQGISSHIDCVPCFNDTIISVSLGSACVMHYTHATDGTVVPILLKPGSLVAMTGESRYGWKHGILARKTDSYHGQTIIRQRRISLTFRTIIPPAARG